jgi:AcrR family transcriptional regulator
MKKTARSAQPGTAASPRAVEAARKRQAILAAALAEFTARGFAAARMEDVARRAQVGKGTVYLYFKDKQALFQGLVLDFVALPLATVKPTELRPGERIGDFLKRTLPPMAAAAATSSRGDIVRLLVGDGVRFPGLADAYRKTVVEPMMGRFVSMLSAAARSGELANDAVVGYPQLMVAPVIVGIIWTGLFGKAIPLDVEGMVRTHLGLLFPKPR